MLQFDTFRMNMLMKSSVWSLVGGEDDVCYDGALVTLFFIVLTVFAAPLRLFSEDMTFHIYFKLSCDKSACSSHQTV